MISFGTPNVPSLYGVLNSFCWEATSLTPLQVEFSSLACRLLSWMLNTLTIQQCPGFLTGSVALSDVHWASLITASVSFFRIWVFVSKRAFPLACSQGPSSSLCYHLLLPGAPGMLGAAHKRALSHPRSLSLSEFSCLLFSFSCLLSAFVSSLLLPVSVSLSPCLSACLYLSLMCPLWDDLLCSLPPINLLQ